MKIAKGIAGFTLIEVMAASVMIGVIAFFQFGDHFHGFFDCSGVFDNKLNASCIIVDTAGYFAVS